MTAPPCYDPHVEWDPHVQSYMEAIFGVEHFSRMRAALATPPLSTCLRVNPLLTTPEVSRQPNPPAHESVKLSIDNRTTI